MLDDRRTTQARSPLRPPPLARAAPGTTATLEASAGGRPAGGERPGLAPYGVTLATVLSALMVGLAIRPVFGVENVDLVFLTGVVAVAVRYGLVPSLLAVAVSSLAYNFFFLPPLYTFGIAEPTNVGALFFFTVVAVLVSNLASRVRAQATVTEARNRTTEALYSFSRKLSSCGSLDDVLWATAYQVAMMLNVRVVILLPEDGGIAVKAGYPPEDSLDEPDLAAARWAFDHQQAAGRGEDHHPGARRLFLPVRTAQAMVGVVGLDADEPGVILSPEQHRLFDALTDQAALAIDRIHLVDDLDRARLAAETDRLRQALLTSISHDLKTPLASVLGAAGTLRDLDAALSPEAKAELLATVVDEAERLNRFIANLLDMTRLEAGALAPNFAAVEVLDIVDTALRRAARILAGHRMAVDLAPQLPFLRVDPVLMEQVLFNLLDNAAKYAPEGSTISLTAREQEGAVILQLADRGPGIETTDLDRIFDKFYRVRKGDHVRAGTGLGLAICRGFVEAMGGTIRAGNRQDGPGAVFTLTLPTASPATPPDDAP